MALRRLSTSALARYEARPGILADASQRAALRRLDALHDSMKAYSEALGVYAHELAVWRAQAERVRGAREAAEAAEAARREPLELARGLAARVASWLAPVAQPRQEPPAASLSAILTAAERAHPFWQLGLRRSKLADL